MQLSGSHKKVCCSKREYDRKTDQRDIILEALRDIVSSGINEQRIDSVAHYMYLINGSGASDDTEDWLAYLQTHSFDALCSPNKTPEAIEKTIFFK